METPQLVIFDWEGTLVDSGRQIISCVEKVTKKLNLKMPEDSSVRAVMGLSLQAAIQKLFPDLGPSRQTVLFSEFRLAYLDEEKIVPLFPGVCETLDYLKDQHILLAIATGKSRQGLEHDLEITGLKKYFIATRCAEETFAKPHPAMVLELLSELQVEPEKALIVGDTAYDILMARNAHVGSVAAAYGTNSLEELENSEPTYIIYSLDDLIKLCSGAYHDQTA